MMVHTRQEIPAAAGGHSCCLQTGRAHFWGDVLMFVIWSHSYHAETMMHHLHKQQKYLSLKCEDSLLSYPIALRCVCKEAPGISPTVLELY